MYRSKVFVLLVVVAVMGLMPPGAALWETQFGSTARSNHCDPISAPVWQPPGLLQLFAGNRDSWHNQGLWVVSAHGLDWAPDSERLLITIERDYGQLRHYNERLEEVWTRDIGHVDMTIELFDIEGLGVPQMLIPFQGMLLRDLQGNVIRSYLPVSEVPGVLAVPAHGISMPAVGDFTGDGAVEIINVSPQMFPTWWANRGSDGGILAQQRFLDEDMSESWTMASHREGDRDYAYLVTIWPKHVNDTTPSVQRLNKVALEPGPGGAGPEWLSHRFEILWSRDFASGDSLAQLHFFDLTGDGRDEVILAHSPSQHTAYEHAFTILDRDGNILFRFPGAYYAEVAVGDVNGDGVPEVVALLSKTTFNPIPEPLWEPGWVAGVQWNGDAFEQAYFFQADAEFGGRRIAVCDVTGDGADEVILGLGETSSVRDTRGFSVGDGKVKVLDLTGRTLWEYRMFYGLPVFVVVDDFTGDGAYEIIVGTQAGQVFVFSAAVERSIEDYEWFFRVILDELRRARKEDVERWRAEVASWEWGEASVVEPEGDGAEGGSGEGVPSAVVVPAVPGEERRNPSSVGFALLVLLVTGIAARVRARR